MLNRFQYTPRFSSSMVVLGLSIQRISDYFILMRCVIQIDLLTHSLTHWAYDDDESSTRAVRVYPYPRVTRTRTRGYGYG